jgi:carbonic anhydrase
LFVVRIAGNALGTEVLGSLRYAAEHLGDSLRLLVVLGHSGCGAVAAGVDTFLRPGGYLDLTDHHDLRGIVDGLLAIVLIAARVLAAEYGPQVGARGGYRDAVSALSIALYAALERIRLERLEGCTPATTVCGVRLLRDRYAPGLGALRERRERLGLGDPPADLSGFASWAVPRQEPPHPKDSRELIPCISASQAL